MKHMNIAEVKGALVIGVLALVIGFVLYRIVIFLIKPKTIVSDKNPELPKIEIVKALMLAVVLTVGIGVGVYNPESFFGKAVETLPGKLLFGLLVIVVYKSLELLFRKMTKKKT